MSDKVTGTFDVQLHAAPADTYTDSTTMGRMTLDKQFHGDLEGTSKGQMLTGGTVATGSGVYVAVEKVTGSLKGLSGSFILHHTGIMDKGAQQLMITVVPGSGTGQLVGLTGTMGIDVKDGKHFYGFEYAIAAKP